MLPDCDTNFDGCVADDFQKDDNDLYLSDCRIALVGFKASEMRKLVSIICRGGGSRYMSLNENLTHIVVGTPSEIYSGLMLGDVVFTFSHEWACLSCLTGIMFITDLDCVYTKTRIRTTVFLQDHIYFTVRKRNQGAMQLLVLYLLLKPHGLKNVIFNNMKDNYFAGEKKAGKKQYKRAQPIPSSINLRPLSHSTFDRKTCEQPDNQISWKEGVSDIPAVDKWMSLLHPRDQYNREDFQTSYDNAKFYVIKSISEDDIHKGIKYNVWSSTNRGNGKLNDVFRETQDDTTEADSVCPIFLFFSVNWSGQFVGVAEMIGRVDFVKILNFWLIEDWNGFFPVKWHIIKDIPNRQLSHIITESSEPVTRTRDMFILIISSTCGCYCISSQIGLQQGLEMLNIFKNNTVRTSMLDDFNFYEKREQSLRAKTNSVRAT
ncbi:hypothetical protein POM88_016572 [Heracleum sosnowskyi]|uniref:YTH domain-containing family protein n=1 Tax=Heracleum sosnowskyi TaxID=360622 RepID=A0AAD8INU2_9APIA|nr:hypothetical protein POM88_016572 [Heracleum sosnowskyi]